MRIVPKTTLRVGKPNAAYYARADYEVDVSDKVAEQLIQQGIAREVIEPNRLQGDSLMEVIMDGIEALAPGDFAKEGKPKIKAIEALIGQTITATDRDKAWTEYQKLAKAT